VDAVFAEVHDDPPNALSDAPTQLSPDDFRTLVTHVLTIRRAFDAVAGPSRIKS